MRRSLIAAAALSALVVAPAVVLAQDASTPALAPTTLRVLVHQNPPFTAYMEQFNAKFQEAHPGVTVEMSVVAPNDLATATQTRLAANDVDVVDIFAFSNAVKPYMTGATPPIWQTLVDAGQLLDITGQPFVANYDPAATAAAGTYNDKVYAVNLGRVGFSGLYLNRDLFEAQGVAVPTTWDELVAACQTFTAADVPCITAGGQDGWPIFVTGYGILGNAFPDAATYVQGLWDGSIKWNDEANLAMWEQLRILAQQMIEPGATGITGDGAPGRFASGDVAMLSGFTWLAPAIEAAQPAFTWQWIPFPASNDPAQNGQVFGKYDQGWAINANSANQEAALAYLSEFSDPANYQEFVTAVGVIPTQPTATLDTQLGREIAPYLDQFKIGFELEYVRPTGAGDFAYPWASFFTPFGTFETAQEAGDAAQADLQAGLDANQ
jgi:raffinose/stachyose/melibiose transport system substrate-binding protein